MTSPPLLSLLVFTPWLGAALLAVLRGTKPALVRPLALAFSLSTLALAGIALTSFDRAQVELQFVERHTWIGALNVHYYLGLDGLSLILVLLTGIVSPIALIASWRIARQPRLFHALFLILQGSALGVFLALDFFHWFLFWELSLVPAFFLIKLWGSASENSTASASRAAYQFVIYTIGGSAFMLVGFVALYVATGTFDFRDLARLAAEGDLDEKLGALGGNWARIVFLGILLGLAVKVPLWPFHTWQAPAYAAAPVGASIFLTSVMSKMGLYGFLRILWPIFPEQLAQTGAVLTWLALAGVVFGAFAALAQKDLKRMLAYSSLNHLSYCLLAIFVVPGFAAAGAQDAVSHDFARPGIVLQMFNHGLSAAALFYCVGILENRSGGRRGLDDFGGVRTAAPVFAGLCGISMFSSLGLPGLNGFVGEFLIFRGVFALAPWAAAIACIGLLVTAIFLLTFWQRVFHGPQRGAGAANFRDVRGLELVGLLPVVALMFVLGVVPQLILNLYHPMVTAWTSRILPG